MPNRFYNDGEEAATAAKGSTMSGEPLKGKKSDKKASFKETQNPSENVPKLGSVKGKE